MKNILLIVCSFLLASCAAIKTNYVAKTYDGLTKDQIMEMEPEIKVKNKNKASLSTDLQQLGLLQQIKLISEEASEQYMKNNSSSDSKKYDFDVLFDLKLSQSGERCEEKGASISVGGFSVGGQRICKPYYNGKLLVNIYGHDKDKKLFSVQSDSTIKNYFIDDIANDYIDIYANSLKLVGDNITVNNVKGTEDVFKALQRQEEKNAKKKQK